MKQIFPRAHIPLTPLLGDKKYQLQNRVLIPSVLDIENCCLLTSGRAAIAIALKHAGIGSNDEVLIPAYHCEAMVAPAKWLEAKVNFYEIQRDTRADIEDIKQKITTDTKALVVTHYFGFLQNLEQIRQLCDQHNIILIEDCAHAFFGKHNETPVGSTGDYSIASSMKFLPLYDGGLLCSTKHTVNDVELTSPGISFQIKSIINILEKSIGYNRLGLLGKFFQTLFLIKTLIWNSVKRMKGNKPSNIGPGSSEGGFGLDSEWIYKSCSHFSKWVIKHTDLNTTALQRQNNYQKLHNALSTLPNCKPLFKELTPDTAPFVYPLYVNNPDYYFTLLKKQGVPIWRFGEYLDAEITEQAFPVSVEYSRHIFQFPCHQSLTEQELDWMIAQISQTLNKQE